MPNVKEGKDLTFGLLCIHLRGKLMPDKQYQNTIVISDKLHNKEIKLICH